MARAIIRVSLDGDTGSTARNVIVPILEAAGFRRIGTLSYEINGPDTNRVLRTLNRVINVLANLPGSGTLDHLWIYLDRPPDPN